MDVLAVIVLSAAIVVAGVFKNFFVSMLAVILLLGILVVHPNAMNAVGVSTVTQQETTTEVDQ